jgi:hypothetical protein
MIVYVHLVQPPISPYFSLVYAPGGQYVQIHMHHDKPTEDREFPSMDAFLEWAGENNLKLPWQQ